MDAVLARQSLGARAAARVQPRTVSARVPVARPNLRARVPPGVLLQPSRGACIQVCYSNSSHSSYSGEPWQQWRTEQSLEQLLEPYGVRTVRSIRNHPEHAEHLETLVVLASILHPEQDEELHEILENFPEVTYVSAEDLLRAFNALHAVPECYDDLDVILLAARTRRNLPLSMMHKVNRLANVYYDVLNCALPTCVVLMLGVNTSFSLLCHRIRRLATLLSPHAAHAAISQHPQILDYESEDLEKRLRALEQNFHITEEQAAKAAAKAPGILMYSINILYYRVDQLAERFALSAQEMQGLFLAEPRVVVQDLDILCAKWEALSRLAAQLPEWEEEVAQNRSAFLVQLARANVVMLQKMAYEISDGTRITGDCCLLDLLYLERQYWRSKSEAPPPPRYIAEQPEEFSDEEDE